MNQLSVTVLGFNFLFERIFSPKHTDMHHHTHQGIIRSISSCVITLTGAANAGNILDTTAPPGLFDGAAGCEWCIGDVFTMVRYYMHIYSVV
jgi:hypothetical protein